MKIGFTGNRKGFTGAQLTAISRVFSSSSLSAQKISEAHHGDCVGSDTDFHFFIRNLMNDVKIIVHPPANDNLRSFCPGDTVLNPKEYLVRNKDIVEATDLMIATPAENKEKLRSGTWATIRTARKFKKPLIIIFPDGKLKIERSTK
jgi:hypothetical protein